MEPDSPSAAAPDRPRGRPSLTDERRGQILDAFLDLIAARGLEAVSLDDVARASGVQRSVVRHYVGNRADLIHGAVGALADRYERRVRAELGPRPTVARFLRLLFGERWRTGMATEDRALDELLREATRDAAARRRLKAMFDLLIDELAAAIGREHPRADPIAVHERAFAVVCLAEQGVLMRELGYPAATTRSAARLGRRLVDELGGLPATAGDDLDNPPRPARRPV